MGVKRLDVAKGWIAAVALAVAWTAVADRVDVAAASIDSRGDFRLSDPDVSLTLTVVGLPWKPMDLRIARQPASDGVHRLAGTVCPPNGGETVSVTGSLSVASSADGALGLDVSFVADRTCEVATAGLSVEIPFADLASGSAVIDDVRRFPLNRTAPTRLFDGRATTLDLRGADGARLLSFRRETPGRILVQDNRAYGTDSLTVRVAAIDGDVRRLVSGQPVGLSVSVQGRKPFVFGPFAPLVMEANADWIPLKPIRPWVVPESVLDFSRAEWVDAPAGRHGRVRARGQDFEYERRPGQPQRFYGVNLCGTANIPPEEAAAGFAANLRRIGYNAVRFHHHDGLLTQGAADGVSLNDRNMRRFDRLVAACLAEGLSFTTDLYVSRPVLWRQCGIDLDGGPSDNAEYKGLVLVHEGCYSNFIAYARNFLLHVNPFTGRSYAQEPALIFLSLVNEGNPGNRGMALFRHAAWRSAWRKWLSDRAASDARFAAFSDEIPRSLRGRDEASAAFLVFLKDMESRFAARVRRFLRDELTCDVLITDQNGWTYPAVSQSFRVNWLDCFDDHGYVDHPHYLDGPYRPPTSCPNVNTLKGRDIGILGLAARRILTMPYTVSEFNYSVPGNYRGAGGLLFGAQAALQNWAAAWRFAWSHDEQGILAPEKRALAAFDVAGDPLMLLSDRMALQLFLRRDLAELTETYALHLDPARLDTELGRAIHLGDISWCWAAWWRKIGTTPELRPGWSCAGRYPQVYSKTSDEVARDLFGRADALPSTAGGGKVSLDPNAGAIAIATDRLCAGFCERGRLVAGALEAVVSGSPATVCASVVDEAASIAASRRLLVSHLTMLRDTGNAFSSDSARILYRRGRLPHLVRRGVAEISLALGNPSDYEVWAVRLDGSRVCRVPSEVREGRLAFTADVARDRTDATMLYEVVCVK